MAINFTHCFCKCCIVHVIYSVYIEVAETPRKYQWYFCTVFWHFCCSWLKSPCKIILSTSRMLSWTYKFCHNIHTYHYRSIKKYKDQPSVIFFFLVHWWSTIKIKCRKGILWCLWRRNHSRRILWRYRIRVFYLILFSESSSTWQCPYTF